jgi:hypothetical protein
MGSSVRSSRVSARPRFQTELPAGLPSWAPAAERFMQALGRPAMPWQRDVLRIGCSLTADGTAMQYPYVVLHVPRRAGKTASTLGVFLQRLATDRNRKAWYTAQTRADASTTFREDWAPLIRGSFLHPRALKLRQSNGSESVRFLPTDSTLSLFAPTQNALHGKDSDAACVDEAWAFTLDAGGVLEAGIQPAQLTRPLSQLWIISAGGTYESTWLDHWMQLGRDGTPGVALIDYGADPGDDLDDPRVWERVHPAVGHTVTVDAIASLRGTMPETEWQRAVLGLWTPADSSPTVIQPELWRAAYDPDTAPAGRSLAFGVETSRDGTRTAFTAAALDSSGRLPVEVIDEGSGTAWAVRRWRELRSTFPGARLYADALGPTAAVVDAIRRARLPIQQLTTAEYVAACSQVLDDLRAGVLRHRGQPLLDAAAAGVTARALGDRWVWDRRTELDVHALVAVTVACHGARRPRASIGGAVAAG